MDLTVPAFKVVFNGKDNSAINQFFKDRIISLSIKDASNDGEDNMIMSLSNPGRQLPRPKFGDKIDISIGYSDKLVLTNRYILDEYQITRPPEVFIISGATHDSIGEFEAYKRDHTYQSPDKKTGLPLQEILKQIAGRYSKNTHISDALKDAVIITEQKNQSDLQYLHAVVKEMDGAVKISGNTISLVKLGLGKNADGKVIPVVKINMSDTWNFNLTVCRNSIYHGAIAYYYKDNKTKAYAGNSDDIREKGPYGKTDSGNVLDNENKLIPGKRPFTMSHVYPTKASANNRANKKLAELKRREQKLTFTTVGNPALVVEAPIQLLSGIDQLPKCWIVDSVTHTLSSKGFISQVTAYQPDMSAGGKCPCERRESENRR